MQRSNYFIHVVFWSFLVCTAPAGATNSIKECGAALLGDLTLQEFTKIDPARDLYYERLEQRRYEHHFSSPREQSNDHSVNAQWRTCTPASLRGHIANAHFQARTLRSLGIARWDIEIAQYRGIPLDWVVKKAYEKLERTDADIQEEIDLHSKDSGVTGEFTVTGYKTVLVKNLRFIEQVGLAKIDWERVERAFPGAFHITVDPETDSKDGSFKKLVVPFLR